MGVVKLLEFALGSSVGAPTQLVVEQPQYVGTNPEVGGSSPFQLLYTHKRVQVLNPAGAITVKLPTTSVLAGEVFTIVNQSANLVTVQSSGANTIDEIIAGYVKVVALQDAPTSSSHWRVIDVAETFVHTTNWSGIWASPKAGNVRVTRAGKLVTLTFNQDTMYDTASVATVVTMVTALPSRVRPDVNFYAPCVIRRNNTDGVPGLLAVQGGGGIVVSHANGTALNGAFAGASSEGVTAWSVAYGKG